MKYIINTDALYGGDIYKSMLLMGANGRGEVIVQKFNLDELEELNGDYINEHFSDLQDTAYQQGLEEGKKAFDLLDAERNSEYQRGFEDGKAVSDKRCVGCKWEGNGSDHSPCDYCCNCYSNQWTAKDDKITVGDEVKYKEYKYRFVVTKMQNGYVYGISKDGSWNNFRNDGSLVKTGRHFDIDKILEDMRND